MSNHPVPRLLNGLRQPGLVKDLVSGGVGNIGLKVAQILLAMTLSAILARVLGPANYGIYAYVFTLVSVLLIPAEFGLTKLIIRETANGDALGNLSLIRGVWTWAMAIGFGSISIVVIVALIVLFMLHLQLPKAALYTCIAGILLLPLLVLTRFAGGALRGLRYVVVGQAPDTLVRPGVFAALILIAVFGLGTKLTAPFAMGLHVIAAVVSLFTACIFLFVRRPQGLVSSGDRIFRQRTWFGAATSFILISGTYQINQYTDILMLGIFGTKEQVGLYRVAVQAGLLGLMGLQAAQMLAQPYIARFYSQDNRRRLEGLLKACSRGAFLLSLLVFIVLLVFGRKLIVLVFGREYLACYVPLLVLAAGQLVNSFFGVVNILLEMTGHQKDSAQSFFVGAVCNILLNLILIPRLGLIGAASATAISTLLWNILLWAFAHKRLGLGGTAIGGRVAS